MPAPDEVVFGPGVDGKPVGYGAVRRLGDDGKVAALKHRLDGFVIQQIDELGKSEGVAKAYSPFPLALLTCVAIETLGQVMYFATSEEGQRAGFLKVAKALHVGFSRPLNRADKEGVATLFPEKDSKKIESVAHLLYYYQRNTMIHGYQSRGVYLTEDLPEWKLEDGALFLNPYWLWRRLKATHEDLFERLSVNREPTNPLRSSALQYISRMLT